MVAPVPQPSNALWIKLVRSFTAGCTSIDMEYRPPVQKKKVRRQKGDRDRDRERSNKQTDRQIEPGYRAENM